MLVSGEFPPMQGGVGDYTREIGLALHDLGCEVHVATSTTGDLSGTTRSYGLVYGGDLTERTMNSVVPLINQWTIPRPVGGPVPQKA